MEYYHLQDDKLLLWPSYDDNSAFDETYKRYWSDVFNFGYNIFRQRIDANELRFNPVITARNAHSKSIIKNLSANFLVSCQIIDNLTLKTTGQTKLPSTVNFVTVFDKPSYTIEIHYLGKSKTKYKIRGAVSTELVLKRCNGTTNTAWFYEIRYDNDLHFVF